MVTSVITEKERKKMMTWTSEKKKKRTTWNWNQAPPKRADGQKQKATQFIPGCGVTRLLPKQNPPQKKIGNIALSSSPSKKRCQKKRIFFIALPFSFCTLTLRPPRYKTFQKKKIIFCPLIRFSMEHSSSSSKAAFLQRQSKWMTHTWDPATIRVSFFKKKKNISIIHRHDVSAGTEHLRSTIRIRRRIRDWKIANASGNERCCCRR